MINITKKERVFVSFDYDHDKDLKVLLIGQSKLQDSPFEISDWSIKQTVFGDWKKEAEKKIKQANIVVVICGKHTNTATGVGVEVKIAQDSNIPYFLIAGRKDGGNRKPTTAKNTDKLYTWSWPILKKLIHGQR